MDTGLLLTFGVFVGAPSLAWGLAITRAEGIRGYFKDLRRGMASSFEASSVDNMARVERELALAEIAILAALADREITDDERHALKVECEVRSLKSDDVIARINALSNGLADEAALRQRVELLGKRLDEPGRAVAFAIVTELAKHGSRLRGEGGYRGATKSSPEALLELFGAALGIERKSLVASDARLDE